MKNTVRPNFWKNFSLNELNSFEWEALCDGCGKCCLIKLQDEETNKIHYTSIACRLFDDKTCRCKNYQMRKKKVSKCIILTSENLKDTLSWMPKTCAYRLIYEGKELEPWHHLRSGNKGSIHDSGKSLKNATTSENNVPAHFWKNYITSKY